MKQSILILNRNTRPNFLLKMVLLIGLVEVKTYKAPKEPIVTPGNSKTTVDSDK